MNAAELVRAIEARGGHIQTDGLDLLISPRSVIDPLRAQLIAHKQEIIEFLTIRQQMPPGVRLLRYQPAVAPVRISPCSTVTNTERFIRSTLVQLAACLRGETWQSGNWGLEGLVSRLSAAGCDVELDDPRRARQ